MTINPSAENLQNHHHKPIKIHHTTQNKLMPINPQKYNKFSLNKPKSQ